MIEPTEERMLQLAPRVEKKPTNGKSELLAAEVMRLLRHEGLDCSVLLESVLLEATAEDEPRTLH